MELLLQIVLDQSNSFDQLTFCLIVQAVNELSYTKGKDVLIFINSNVSANVKCEYKIEKAQATIVIIDSTRQS